MKALLEQRAKLGAEIRKMADLANDAEHKWTGEDEAKWVKLNADFEELTPKIQRLQRAEKIGKILEEPAGDPTIGREDRSWESEAKAEAKGGEERQEEEDDEETSIEEVSDKDFRGPKNLLRARTIEDERLALNAWCRVQQGMEPTKRMIQACQRSGVNLRRTYLDLPLHRGDYRQYRREMRAAMATTAGIGGETIPAGFMPAFERALLEFDSMRGVAEIVRTASGNALPWPTTNDTGNKGALLAENINTTDVGVTTSSMTLNAYKYTSKLILVSAELLEDSAFDLPSMIGSMCGERIARILQDQFTTGTGTAQPNGIVVASTVGPTGATAGAIIAAEILDLIHAVDPSYRVNGRFMFHDTVFLALKKLTYVATGAYVFQDSIDGANPKIFGYPYTVNQSMAATIAASARNVIFGDLSKYKIRDVGSLRLRRLVERYAEYDQDAFVAFSRHDGDLLDAGTHPVKHLLQHA
jgi:HK97 family phage major capsid protein